MSGGKRPSFGMITSTITAAAAAAAAASAAAVAAAAAAAAAAASASAASAGCCQQLTSLSDLVPDLRHCTFSASCSTLM